METLSFVCAGASSFKPKFYMYSFGMLVSFFMAGYRMAESVDDGLLCSCDVGSCISYQLVVSRLS